ncbi:MAG: nickel-responsive transcriptional regulator NikR [Neorhizobium sp.]|jgi:CopG family nickel-responsive transcriptional regulator|nr:nickel-responsive transcriptional regulator NikR [Neorhizobium sp.]
MQRISITIDEDLLSAIDALSQKRGYASRSEAVRDIVRETLAQEAEAEAEDGPCVAALSYVYQHETRELSKRLTSVQHDHHDLSVSTLHVHLSNADCLEVTVLKGNAGAVRAFADAVTSQRGVRHGHLNVIPAGDGGGHGHGDDHGHDHAHPHRAD